VKDVFPSQAAPHSAIAVPDEERDAVVARANFLDESAGVTRHAERDSIPGEFTDRESFEIIERGRRI